MNRTKPGPKSQYFSLKNCVGEALLYAYEIPPTERLVLGWIVRNTYGWKGSEWVTISLEEISSAFPSVSKRSIAKALTSLRENNAIRRTGKGKKGSPFAYGPQKFVQFWNYPINCENRPVYTPNEDDKKEFEDAQKRASKNENTWLELSSKDLSSKVLSSKVNDKIGSQREAKKVVSSNHESEPQPIDTPSAAADGKTDQKHERHDLVGSGVGEEGEPSELIGAINEDGKVKKDPSEVVQSASKTITDWREAYASKGMTLDDAIRHACENYLQHFARFLNPSEKLKIREMFSIAPKSEALLAVWILAIEKCKDQRRESRGKNSKTWSNIFLHVCDCFSRLYDEIKNGKQKPKKSADEAMGEYFATRRHNPWAKS